MIKIGEYVRTKYGISKVIKNVDEYVTEEQICVDFLGCMYNQVISKRQVKKHSKQLIDLVEVGDYVNGREVKHIAMFEGFPDYPKLIFVDESHLIPDDTCENDEIQTILTKESYMANCYKVGEEDETN